MIIFFFKMNDERNKNVNWESESENDSENDNVQPRKKLRAVNDTDLAIRVAHLFSTGQLTQSTVGLSNVNNTSDVNKPVSTAQQTALDLKVDKSTTINSKALSSNVTLTATDIGHVTRESF